MRNLTNVIEAMLDYIPESEPAFRRSMQNTMRDELYRAPEMQDWSRASVMLAVYMKPFEVDGMENQWGEDWCEVVIRIWKDKV
jgi:hypothetical protein